MVLDIFCNVIDNYGDIAVVYRLVKNLLLKRPSLQIRIFLDHPQTFQALCPIFDPRLPIQTITLPQDGTFTVIDTARRADQPCWREDPADAVIQAFSCDLPPDYYESWAKAPPSRIYSPRPLLLLEYLTAEAWSETTHLIASPLPEKTIQRHFFVPGFRDQAGGIVLDHEFLAKVDRGHGLGGEARRTARHILLQKIAPQAAPPVDCQWMTIFTYEANFSHLFRDLPASGQDWLLIVPAGRSSAGFWRDWPAFADRPEDGLRMTALEVPFLDQETYDDLLLLSDFNLVRGEESWVRAVLSGQLYLWHAYLQDDGYQIKKVEAFLEVWRPWFGSDTDTFGAVSAAFLDFNRRTVNSADSIPQESYAVFWEKSAQIRTAARDFARHLRKNADLAAKLLEFLDRFLI